MATQTFLFTALPNGLSGSNLKLSAFVSPRLDPGRPLGHLSDFTFGNWADRMRSLKVNARFDGAGSVAAQITSTAGLDPALWDRMFPARTLVKQWAFKDHLVGVGGAAVEIVSYPMQPIAAFLGDAQAEVDEKAPSHLGVWLKGADRVWHYIELIAGLEGKATTIAKGKQPGETLDAAIARLGIQFENDFELAYLQWMYFHNAFGVFDPPTPPSAQDLAEWSGDLLDGSQAADFHEAVAFLGDHPVLMRKLGLVIDLEVPYAAAMEGDRLLRLEVSYTAPPANVGTANVTPSTAVSVRRGSQWFRAQERPEADVRDGMLELDNTNKYFVSQDDLDGSCFKWFSWATSSWRVGQGLQPGTLAPFCSPVQDAHEGVPSRRTGLLVGRAQRGDVLTRILERQRTFHQQAAGSVFYADDLVRGLRVDVFDRGAWRTLAARQGEVTIADKAGSSSVKIPIGPEEGMHKWFSATAKPKEPNKTQSDEGVFSWDGWSHVAPQPGKTVVDPSENPPGQRLPRVRQLVSRADGQQGTFEFQCEASFRPVPGGLPRLRFGAQYRFRARTVDLAGNSLTMQQVARDHATPDFVYLRREPIGSPALVPRARYTEGESLETLVVRSERPTETCERHVVAPAAGQRTVEKHGRLDGLMFASATRQQAYDISVLEKGTLMDAALNPVVAVSGDSNAVGTLPVNHGDPLPKGQYVILPAATVPIPYLPDPLADGVAFGDLTGPGSADVHMFDRPSWYRPAPFRLVVRAGSGAQVAVNGNPAATEVSLPPATILRAPCSSVPLAAEVTNLVTWSNLFSPADVAAGRRLTITPPRWVTLVHAVKKPLAPAMLTNIVLVRQRGDTSAAIVAGDIAAHSRSTGEVSLTCEWEDWQDTGDEPVRVKHQGFAHRVTVAYGEDQVNFPVPVDRGPTYPTGLCGVSTATPRLRQEFGDTKHRRVFYRCRSTSRYREYYPVEDVRNHPEDFELSGELSSEWTVLNSAPPPAPKVAYVVPTFQWEGDSNSGSRTRRGGGLRIYLERPWYESGDGELLAVVVADPTCAIPTNDPQLLKYVSRWGHDPLWDSKFARQDATYQVLAGSRIRSLDTMVVNGVLPQETVNANTALTVQVVGHPVSWCKERKLWYADVVFDEGTAYQPMVRLAVARFQPSSAVSPGSQRSDVDLSPIVLLDFVPLTADRAAAVTRSGGRLTIGLVGPSAANRYARQNNPRALADGGHRVVATIEMLENSDNELDWKAVPAAVMSTSQVTLTRSSSSVDPNVRWTGALAVPPARNATLYRVKLQEFEVFTADAGVGQRLAYVDTFILYG